MARMIVVDRDGKEHEIEAKTGLKIMEDNHKYFLGLIPKPSLLWFGNKR